MKEVRIGIVGVGGMGKSHLKDTKAAQRGKLTAVADTSKKIADKTAKQYECKAYYSASDMIQSKKIDAIIIATPHYSHAPIAVEALQAGLHVLVEKPVGVHKADVEKMIAAHTNKKLKFGAMFQQRTLPIYRKTKDIIEKGELGNIIRTNWIITDWFRTQMYYDSGDWRATWAGEGGGVLLNQCPHQLDMFQWLVGMPNRVRAFCHFGKYHNIEVEDEVTAYLEYPNGATGVFITSTGEAPGTNRLEIVGDRGRLTVENGQLKFLRNETPASEFLKTSNQKFAAPPIWDVTIPVKSASGSGHGVVIQTFINAILDNVPMIAEAAEGLQSVELGNAILFSALEDKVIDIPLDGKAFEIKLNKLIKNSKYQKKEVREAAEEDFAASFSHT